MHIHEFKKHFYSGGKYIHLNNSGLALIPDVNRDLAIQWLQRFYEEGAIHPLEMWAQTDVVRGKLAQFFGTHSEQLAFFQTTASALSQAASCVPLKSGDEILTWEQEYPSNFYPWRMVCERHGAQLIQIPSQDWQTPTQSILDRVTKKTRAIAISWVQYQTGSITDLKKLAQDLKGSGIWLIADAIQGAGVRPFNFEESGFDVVCSGSHKYLCSGFGAGFMLVKKERLAEMQPIEMGAMTYGDPDTPKSFSNVPKPDARKFECGSKSVIEIIGLGATLDLFQQTGIENIFSEASRLADRLRDGLKVQGCPVYSPPGPIVGFALKNLNATVERLKAAQVSFALRGPGIRLSTHAYNTDAEIDRVLNLIEG